MRVSITISKVPEDVHDELAARAARAGLSLQDYLLSLLMEAATKPDPAEVIARARERVRRTESAMSAGEITAHVAADRK